jgi:hypothetical protein
VAFGPLDVASFGAVLREAGTVAGNVHVPRRCFVSPTEHVAKVTADGRNDDEKIHDGRAPNNATETLGPEFDGHVPHGSTNGVDSKPSRLGFGLDVIEQILFGVGISRGCDDAVRNVCAGDLESGTVCRWLEREREADGSGGGRTRVDLLGVGEEEGALHNGALDDSALDHDHVG